MHRLRFTAGPLAGRQVEVTSALVLGRQAADLAVDDPQVSRRHAALRPAGGHLELEDLGSLNGTWVNGTRVAGTVPLAPGDQVRIGDTTFEVEVEGESGVEGEGRAGGAAAAPTVLDRPAPPPGPPAPVPPAPSDPTPTPVPVVPFSPPPQREPRRRGVATRRLTPTVLSFGVVVATAVALVLYFALR